METKQIAKYLRTLVKKTSISEEFAKIGPDEKFFEDACALVGLRYEISELCNALEILDKIEGAK